MFFSVPCMLTRFRLQSLTVMALNSTRARQLGLTAEGGADIAGCGTIQMWALFPCCSSSSVLTRTVGEVAHGSYGLHPHWSCLLCGLTPGVWAYIAGCCTIRAWALFPGCSLPSVSTRTVGEVAHLSLTIVQSRGLQRVFLMISKMLLW